MKTRIVRVVAVVFLTAIIFILFTSHCWAQVGATQANLEKIKQAVKPSEAEAESLLGEPKKIETMIKAKGIDKAIHDIACLTYDVEGKKVRIYVDRTLGYVTKVSED